MEEFIDGRDERPIIINKVKPHRMPCTMFAVYIIAAVMLFGYFLP